MATKAVIGKGTLLQAGDTSADDNYTTVAEITSLSGPTIQNENVDATSFDSLAKESIPGLIDYGTVSIAGIFVPSEAPQAELLADAQTRVTRSWRIEWPTSPRYEAKFQAYPQDLTIEDSNASERINFSATLKIAGPVAFAAVQ